MKINPEKLKKIPIFKNVDFEDPRSRKRVGMAFAAVALILIMIVLNLSGSNKDDKQPDPLAANDNVLLEVPEGQDMDILGEEDMVAARSRRMPGNKDIYDASAVSTDDNPLAFLEESNPYASDTVNSPVETGAEDKPAVAGMSRRERAMAMFGLNNDDHTTPETASDTPAQPETKDSRRDAASKAFGLDGGRQEPAPKKTTPKPAPAKKTTPQQKKAADPDMYDDATASAKSSQGVRRSGSISSLDGDWGTVEGISSLDNESQYVNQDEDHPYKVMFTRDQKIKSGERITIRLLEDMAVNGILIPRNTHLSATCQIGERLEIHVSNIEINGKIYALNYTAFDNDGSQGLYCPTTESNRASQQAKSSAGSSATSAISSAAAIAGAAMGSSALGSMIGSMTNVGAQAVTGRGGSVTAEVNSGYVFYLLKDI